MIGSLCTGYAGLDIAAHELTGLGTAFVSDVDPGACRILDHLMPDVPNIGDLTTYDFTPWRGTVRVLTAGYPCQPFSAAGNQRGTADPRHLFPHVARAIGEIRPELVLLENVRGHLRLGFDTVLADLARIGYDARWTLVRASDVGAPHARARLYIAAHPADTDDKRPHGSSAQQGQAGRPSPPNSGHRATPDPDGIRGQVPPPGQLSTIPLSRSQGATGGARLPAPDPDRGQRDGRQPQQIGPEVRRATPTRGSQGLREWGAYGPAIERWEQVTRPAPSPTVGGRLSPAFVEWMMGLPDGWVTQVPGLSWAQQVKALGNGVVPQAAAHAYRSMGVAA